METQLKSKIFNHMMEFRESDLPGMYNRVLGISHESVANAWLLEIIEKRRAWDFIRSKGLCEEYIESKQCDIK